MFDGKTSSSGAPDVELVVISLASAVERRRRVEERLRGFPLPWRFFEAKTSAPAALRYDERRARLHRGRALAAAELGCFGSHYECLRAFAEAGRPAHLIVLEDDVYLDESFPYADLAGLMRACGIDYLRLHATFSRPSRFLGVVWRYRQLVRYVGRPYGTCAYVISPAGARRFVQSVREIVRPIDDELDRFWQNGLPPYAIFPAPAVELFGPGEAALPAAQPVLRGWERCRYLLNDYTERARRVLENLRLRPADRRIRASLRAVAEKRAP